MGMNFCLLLTINKIKRKSLSTIISQSESYDRYLESSSKILSQALINNDLSLIESPIYNESNETVSFDELLKESQKLIVRIPEIDCHVCLEKEFALINDYVSKIGKNNIIILTKKKNIHALKIINNFNFNIYSCDNLEIPFEKENTLYIFVADSSLHIKNFFIPDNSFPRLLKDYFAAITLKYYSAN